MRRTVVIFASRLLSPWHPPGLRSVDRAPRSPALQVALRAHGLYTGAVDGISGPMTRQAVLKLPVADGIRDGEGRLRHALQPWEARRTAARAAAALTRPRRLGRRLARVPAPSLRPAAAKRIDGRFDAATAAALRRFQRSRGLRPDGIAGAVPPCAGARKKAAAKKPVETRRLVHTVAAGEGFGVIARRYRVGRPGWLAPTGFA